MEGAFTHPQVLRQLPPHLQAGVLRNDPQAIQAATQFVMRQGQTRQTIQPGMFDNIEAPPQQPLPIEADAPRSLPIEATPPRAPDFELGSETWGQMSRAADAARPRRQTGNLRNQPNAQLQGIAQQRAAEQTARAAERAAQESIGSQFDRAMNRARGVAQDFGPPVAGGALVGAGLGAGLGVALRPGPQPIPSAPEATDIVAEPDEAPALENTGGTADLAAEASPPPEVADPEPEPRPVRRHLIGRTTEAPPADYSMQARQLIDQLNAMRRAAGGEVPEAQAMQAEINRLLELGNQTRRATFVAAPGDDASRYFQQAQGIIDQLNAAYREGSLTPNSPRAREVMAQVRQLQQAGDNLRNRRAG